MIGQQPQAPLAEIEGKEIAPAREQFAPMVNYRRIISRLAVVRNKVTEVGAPS